ncbi:hypothetical protein HHI36_019894 [Cryptolaemus montrouzieri]|uniref:HAT C-terminal dimerisation domain-containing protein n=1 Tax=Cryptolaemus montrouzieri TaxID=559131 RepID=A0ABD2N911_9CUCU
MATHFHHSLIAQNELEQIQTERLNQTELCIVQDCSTSFNSTYYMMECILKLKDSLMLYSNAHTIPIPTDLEKCITILKPFEEITKELSSATAIIASDIENNPRYKLKFFTEITKDQVQTEILRILGCSRTSNDEGPSSPKRSRTQLPSTSSYIQSCLVEILSASYEEEQNIGDDEDDTVHNKSIVKKALLNEYNREKRLTLSENPLLWWKYKYNSLCALVRQ